MTKYEEHLEKQNEQLKETLAYLETWKDGMTKQSYEVSTWLAALMGTAQFNHDTQKVTFPLEAWKHFIDSINKMDKLCGNSDD